MSGDEHGHTSEAHDCATCGPCADDHRLRTGCYDGRCCQPLTGDPAWRVNQALARDIVQQRGRAALDRQRVPDLSPHGWSARHDHGSGVASLHYPDGSVRIQHRCDRGTRGVIVAAPALQLSAGHSITQAEPLTVTPSILCDDCGLHGFITDGAWRA